MPGGIVKDAVATVAVEGVNEVEIISVRPPELNIMPVAEKKFVPTPLIVSDNVDPDEPTGGLTDVMDCAETRKINTVRNK